jgi:hypothetical protein
MEIFQPGVSGDLHLDCSSLHWQASPVQGASHLQKPHRQLPCPLHKFPLMSRSQAVLSQTFEVEKGTDFFYANLVPISLMILFEPISYNSAFFAAFL